METYYVLSNKYTAKEDSSVRKAKENKKMLLSNSAICGEKKIKKFIKNQELIAFQIISLK